MPESWQEMSEEELMRRSQAGSLEAFEALAARFEPRLYSFIWRWVRHKETAEDLVQETLLKAYKHRLSFRAGSRVSTWIFTLALNLCRDRYRQSRPTSSLSDPAVLSVAERSRWARHESGPEDLAQRREEAGLLMKALAELPEQARDLLALREKEGLTFEEAGRRLKLSPVAARSAASRAYKKLRQKLEGFFNPED